MAEPKTAVLEVIVFVALVVGPKILLQYSEDEIARVHKRHTTNTCVVQGNSLP